MDAENPSVSGNVPSSAPTIFLFGPQTTHFTEGGLLELRNSLVTNPCLKPLVDTIRELPSLWPVLQQVFKHLSRVPGAEQLYQLSQLIDNGTLPDTAALSNIQLIPLTVISQVVDFMCLNEGARSATFLAPPQADSGLGNVQGFCVGFLAAAAVACSRNKTEFLNYSSVALRLAVCIGAIVDLDGATFPNPLDRSSSFAVRWKTNLEQNYFEKILSSYSSVSNPGVSLHASLLSLFYSQKEVQLLGSTDVILQKERFVQISGILIVS